MINVYKRNRLLKIYMFKKQEREKKNQHSLNSTDSSRAGFTIETSWVELNGYLFPTM